MSGQKIIDGLKDAVAGKFDRVTIDGQVWVKNDASHLAKLQRVNDHQHKEIERLRAALVDIAAEVTEAKADGMFAAALANIEAAIRRVDEQKSAGGKMTSLFVSFVGNLRGNHAVGWVVLDCAPLTTGADVDALCRRLEEVRGYDRDTVVIKFFRRLEAP